MTSEPLSLRRTSWSHGNYILPMNEPRMQVNLVEAADTHGRHGVNQDGAMIDIRVDVGVQGRILFGHLLSCIYMLIGIYRIPALCKPHARCHSSFRVSVGLVAGIHAGVQGHLTLGVPNRPDLATCL